MTEPDQKAMGLAQAGYSSDASSIKSFSTASDDESFNANVGQASDQRSNSEETDATRFRYLSREQQLAAIISLLASGKARLDDSTGKHGPLLEDYKKKALLSRDKREAMIPTFLHILARTCAFQGLGKEILVGMIKYLLENQGGSHNSRHQHDAKEYPVLHVAMTFNNFTFINALRECGLPEKVQELLHATNHEEMNSLHYAFERVLRRALDANRDAGQETAIASNDPSLRSIMKMINEFVKDAAPATVASKDRYGNTPIHYALDYANCLFQAKRYKTVIERLLKKGDEILTLNAALHFNDDMRSPYLYFLGTRDKWLSERSSSTEELPPLSREDNELLDKDVAGQRRRASHSLSRARGSPLEEDKEDGLKRPPPSSELEELCQSRPPVAQLHLMIRGEKTEAAYAMPYRARGASRSVAECELHAVARAQLARAVTDCPPPAAGETLPKALPSSQARGFNRAIGLMAAEGLSDMVQSDEASSSNVTPDEMELVLDTTQDEDKASFGTTVDEMEPPSQSLEEEEAESPAGAIRDDTSKASLDLNAEADKIGQLVKAHYLRTRTETEAKKLLYGKVASDRNLYFEASHLNGRSLSEVIDLIEKLSNAGGFEDTLSYVSIPILSTLHDEATAFELGDKMDDADGKEPPGRLSEEGSKSGLGRSALISIFDKLASVNVRRIIRLHVDDRDAVPHTDSAIEQAIRGCDSSSPSRDMKRAIRVDEWDWSKPDLSMDVISFAAPMATHINLYWSGNHTTLKGWLSEDMISRHSSSKRKMLREVTLHAFSGFESRERIKKMIEGFQQEVKVRTNNQVKVQLVQCPGNIISGLDSGDGEDASETETPRGPLPQVWVQKMEEFREAFLPLYATLGSEMTIPRVRVALIDDGVDLLNLHTFGVLEASGMSYCPSDGAREQPWHQSTNGHGTVMANMMTRINPWMSLDVMKVRAGVGSTPAGEFRTIYAASVASAIEDAIIRGVDIISMSFTIRKAAARSSSAASSEGVAAGAGGEDAPTGEAAIEALRQAINKAKDRDILMFCSAADDIQQTGKDNLPYGAAPDSILRIGAALQLGQRDPASEDVRSISYFCPGNQVAESENPDSCRPVEYHDGSSVATALAAGLASLIVQCTTVVNAYHGGRTKPFSSWVANLRKHENMRTAFDNISYSEHQDKKFPPVWKMFGDAAKRIDEAHSDRDKMAKLEELVRELCHKIQTM
ncbi:hypothetical protein V8C44DRAFT_363359 [Trichoderma aethiopicum]